MKKIKVFTILSLIAFGQTLLAQENDNKDAICTEVKRLSATIDDLRVTLSISGISYDVREVLRAELVGRLASRARLLLKSDCISKETDNSKSSTDLYMGELENELETLKNQIADLGLTLTISGLSNDVREVLRAELIRSRAKRARLTLLISSLKD